MLPIVYPIVLYNRKQRYRHSQDIFELFADQKDLARPLMLQPFQLVNLMSMDDKVLEKHHQAAAMELIMKHIHTKEVLNKLELILNQLNKMPGEHAQRYIDWVLTYVFNTGKISKANAIDMIIKSTLMGGKMKTLAEQFREEGKLEGK